MRQSRYLLVTNLPENISEEKIIKHFKRFGKVQSVKLLPPGSSSNHSDSSPPGLCAAVAFTDIRSAAKAFEEERQQIEDRVIRTEYYEPAASSSSSSAAIYIHDTRDDALRGSSNCNNSSRNERERGNGGPSLPHSSSSSTSSSSSSSREYDNNTSSRVHSSSSSRFADPHPSSSSTSRRTGGYSRSSPPPTNNSSSTTTNTSSSSSGHIHSSRPNPSSSSTVRTTSGERKRPISDGTSLGSNNNNNSSRRSSEYGTPEGGGHYYHSSSSSHHHHNRGRSFSPSKMISENSDSPLRGEVDLSPSRVNMDSPSVYSRRRSSNVRSNNTSDLDPRRSFMRSTSSPGRYHEREGDGEERGRERERDRSSRHFSPPSLNHRDSSSSVMRSSGTNNSYRGTTAPRSPGSSRSSSVISNSSRAEAMEKDAMDLDKDSSSHLYSSSRRRSSDGVSLNVDSKENLRSYSSMDSQDSLLISRGDGHPPPSGGSSSTSSALKRKYSEGDHITRDSSDVDSVHISERKRRLLECVKPVNTTPKDSLSSSSAVVIANVNTSSATPSELSNRTDGRDRDSNSKGDHPSLHHRHHHHHHNQHSSSTHHSSSHTPFLSKSSLSSSVDSSDELQGDTRKLFQDPQLLLKILDEAINSHGGGGSEGGKSSGSTDLIGSKTSRKPSLTDSNHSSSSGRRNRDPTSRSHLHKDPSTIPTIDATSCVVNPSLVDPRREWPAYSSVFPSSSSATTASSSSSLSTSTLLNSSSSEKSNNRVDPLDAETGLVSSTDSLPQDVHSTSNKSDDLLHGCEVSSSSDKTTSKPKKVMKLPLPEFAVLMLGASAAAIASKSHHGVVPGMTSLTVNPSLPSPKNTSITSPINTCSPCPIPPKRLRDRSTDSKGSEVTTSDRDSTENLTFSKSLDSSSLSDHSDPSPSKGIEERIRALDEKLITRPNLANIVTAASSSSSSSLTAAIGLLSCNPSSHRSSEPATPTIDYSKYNIKKKSQANQGGASGESQKNEQSDIVKNLLKSSIFDQDSKRLEHINEKYEPKDHASVTSETTTPTTATTSSNSAPSATVSASSTPSGSMSNYRIPLRTKAAAKEFPSSNDTPSTSGVSRTSTSSLSSTSTTGLTGLASLSRKMSEPSKLPSNLKKDAPTTPQSAPARSFSSAYGPFASLADKKGSIDCKTAAVKDPRREAAEFRDPRTHKSPLVSSALPGSTGEPHERQRASIQKSLSMPTGAKSTPLMKSENRPFSSLLSSKDSKDSKEHEGVHNKRKPSTEGIEGESDGTSSSKNEMGKLSAASKNSSTYSGKVPSKESSLSATTKAESQPSIKSKDKGDKEAKGSKGNEVGKQQTSLSGGSSSSSKGTTGEKVKSSSSKSLDNSTSKTGLKEQKQAIASSSGGKASTSSTSLNKEKAKSLKDKIMDNKKSSSTSNNKDQAKESLQEKKGSSKESKTSKDSKNSKASDKKAKEKQQGKHAQDKKERKKLQELQRLGDAFKLQEDEPVYLSMYDKVKQRSANLQNKNVLDHTHPPSSSSSTKGGKTATSDKSKKSSRVKDSDSSDSDDDDSDDESSESESSSDADARAVSLNKRRRKPVIESSSSSSSSDDDDEDDDDDDEDDDEEEEDLSRKKKTSPAKRSPVRGSKTTKTPANKNSVPSSNRSKRPVKSSSSSDSEEEEVIKAKKKLKTKKKPKPSYSDSDSDEEEEDIVRRKPSSNKKPQKASRGGKATAIISSDEQSSAHESKSSSVKGAGMENKKTKKASSLMSTSSSSSKQHQGDLSSHPSGGKKNKAEKAAGDKREQHKEDIKGKGEPRTDANTNSNNRDRSHSHPTPTTGSKTSKEALLSESKVVSSSSVKGGDLQHKKKKGSSSSSAIKGDKGERTAKTSSTSPSLKDKEQENRKVMERKKGETEERDSDSSKTSKMISPSSQALKKLPAKGEKDTKRKDGVPLSSTSPSKDKNSSSKLSSIHRSSHLKATSSESLSSKVTSDQDEKSDSDIDRREPFRRLEAFLSKSDLKSESSSDEDEGRRKPAFSHKHATPGVISHTEWERAECGKVISPSSSFKTSSSSSPAKKDKAIRESGGHHHFHQTLDKKSSAISRLSSDVDAKSKSFLSSSSSTLEKKTTSSKKGKRDEDKAKAPLDRIKTAGITTTATSHHIPSKTALKSSLPDPAKSSPPIVSSTSDSLPSSHFFKSPEPESPIHGIRDDLSDSLEDYKLDQDLSEEARRSAEKAERYKNHESDSSGDDLIISKSPLISPLGRNKKDQTEERPVRSFDQEAAIEAKRLEVELNQSWKKSEVSSSPFGDLICSTSANSTRDSSSLPRSDANLNSLSIHIPGVESVVKMPDVHTSPLFHRHLPSDLGETGVPNIPLKEEGDANETTKDESSEVDNQRINEDDMAVSALLQEMDEKTSLEIPTIEVPEGAIEDAYNLLPDDEPHPLQISEDAVETEHQGGSRSSLHLSPPFDSKDSLLHHRPETTSVRGGLEPDSISDVTSSSSTARTTTSVLLVPDELSCDRSIHPYIEPSKQQQEQMKERSERLSISSHSSSGSGSSPSPAVLSSFSPSKRLTVDSHHHLHLSSDGIGVGGMHDLTNIPHSASALVHVSGVKEMTPGEVESLRTRVGGEEENETKVKVHDDSRSSKTITASDADTSKEDEAAPRETGEEASDRPKRGRRPKTRKFSESGLVLPRYEGSGPESTAPQSKEQQQQAQSTPVSNRLTRRSALTAANASVEKIRRSPRVASVDPDATSTTTFQTSGEEGSGDEKHQADDRRRSGRRKKTTSGDSVQKGSDQASAENALKTPTKEGRLLGRRQRGDGEKVSEQNRKSAANAYDVFEFTDEEDEAGPIPLHEAMHASKVPTELLHQPDKKSGLHLDESHEEDKDRDGEVSSHGHKLSLTIRHDSVTGTAEVVKTSKALVSSEEAMAGETPLPVQATLSAGSKVTAKSSAGLPPSTLTSSSALSTMTAAEQEMAEVKATRKSARLMSQNKSTVDEVIEDVIKGGENSPRLRRLQRGVRRSEENNLTSSAVAATGSAVAGDSNDDELSEDTENVSCKDSISGRETRHQRSYRITRSSTRGSIASEEATDASSSSASMFDETSSHSTTTTTPTLIVAPAAAAQPGSRRHSHPIPAKEKTLDHQSSLVLSKDDSAKAEAVISSDLQTVVSSASHPPSSVLVSTAAGLHSTSSVVSEKKSTEASFEKKSEIPPSVPVSVVDVVTTQPSTTVASVIQEPMRTVTPFIPSVSERIHNSTTAQKLKTGKAFLHLDQDLSKSSSSFSLQGLSAQPSLHSISSGVGLPPSSATTADANNVPISSKGEVRVQPPPAHTKITIEPKQPSIQSTVMAGSTGYASPAGAPSTIEQKSSPVIVQGRITHTPDLIQRQQQSGSPGFPSHFSQGGGDGRSQGALSQSQKEFLLQQEALRQQQQHQIQHGRPTPPPAPSPSLSLPPNLPPELHQHYKQLGHLPPHLMSHPSDMPFNFPHVIFPPSYPMHPDLARLHGLGPHPRPYGVPLPFDTRAPAKEDERSKLQRQKEQERVEEEYKRAREQEGSLLMPTGLPSHLRPSLSSYPSAPGLVRQGIAPHLLSPHDRLTDSPAVMGHGFRHLPPHPSNDSKSTHEIALHSPASKSGQQTPEGLTRVYGHPSIGSPAPGYLDSRSLHQPAHSPVFRHNIPSPAGQRMEEDSRAKLPHHIASLGGQHAPSSGFHLPHLQQHQLSMEEGLLRRLPSMGSEAPGVPLIPPPPAHGMTQPHTHPQTPPYAQVPASGDSQILQRYPIVWRGLLALKNDQASVQIQFISGNQDVARTALPPMADGQAAPVRISQRMRLEQSQLEGVARKMQSLEEHAILLALPCGRDQMDVLQQSNNLRNGFIQYLQSKQAAGIVNFSTPGSQATTHVIHIFPSGDFANGHLVRIAPDLLHGISGISHMVIIITTV